MNPILQTLIRSALKIMAGYLAAKGLADEATAEQLTAGALALVSIIWGVLHRTPQNPPEPPNGPRPPGAALALLAAGLLLLPGCAMLHSDTERATTDPATGRPVIEKTHARAYTCFDANAALAKFRNSPTAQIGTNGYVMPAGTSLSGLDQTSSSPNLDLGTILGQAMRTFTGQAPALAPAAK